VNDFVLFIVVNVKDGILFNNVKAVNEEFLEIVIIILSCGILGLSIVVDNLKELRKDSAFKKMLHLAFSKETIAILIVGYLELICSLYLLYQIILTRRPCFV
jgi:hypothetical protein